MKNTQIFLFLLFSINLNAQVNWTDDFNIAQSIALKSGKLIVVDFWATWCGPCKTMDRQLWQSSDMPEISKRFIGLKVDVDYNKSKAARYNVNLIPKVIIIACNGNVIWEKEGFNNAEDYLSVLEAIPQNIRELNIKLTKLAENKKDLQTNYETGIEFQLIGRDISNYELKNSFFDCSRFYLNISQKLNKDPILAEEIELHIILNDVYLGKTERAMKKIEKMWPGNQNENIADLRHYILAMCYKDINDPDKFLKEKQQIKNKEFVSLLEK